MSSEQRPPVNKDHYFRVPSVAVVHRFDCTQIIYISYFPFQGESDDFTSVRLLKAVFDGLIKFSN